MIRPKHSSNLAIVNHSSRRCEIPSGWGSVHMIGPDPDHLVTDRPCVPRQRNTSRGTEDEENKKHVSVLRSSCLQMVVTCHQQMPRPCRAASKILDQTTDC